MFSKKCIYDIFTTYTGIDTASISLLIIDFVLLNENAYTEFREKRE